MMTYILPQKRQRIVFEKKVVDRFLIHRQVLPSQKEAGGQMFANITPNIVSVSAATGPHRLDTRRRFSLFLNKRLIQREIDLYFKRNIR